MKYSYIQSPEEDMIDLSSDDEFDLTKDDETTKLLKKSHFILKQKIPNSQKLKNIIQKNVSEETMTTSLWLLNISIKYNIALEDYFCSLYMLEIVLNEIDPKYKENLILIQSVCLHIVHKLFQYGTTDIIEIREWIYLSKHKFKSIEFKKMEIHILQTLNFELYPFTQHPMIYDVYELFKSLDSPIKRYNCLYQFLSKNILINGFIPIYTKDITEYCQKYIKYFNQKNFKFF